MSKKCAGCVRFEERDRPGEEGTYHCCRQDYKIDKFPDDNACELYWDRAEYEAEEKRLADEQEKKRQEMWAIYADKPPVKLPIVFDGYGVIPECPVCHEMPYSTEQCHWCGQHFIQDEEIEEYNKPDITEEICLCCGGKLLVVRSKYNGHTCRICEQCGLQTME